MCAPEWSKLYLQPHIARHMEHMEAVEAQAEAQTRGSIAGSGSWVSWVSWGSWGSWVSWGSWGTRELRSQCHSPCLRSIPQRGVIQVAKCCGCLCGVWFAFPCIRSLAATRYARCPISDTLCRMKLCRIFDITTVSL